MDHTNALPLQTLTHRLSQCPAAFLAEPLLAGRGVVHVDAVVADLLVDLGGELAAPASLGRFKTDNPARRNELRIVLIAAWLLHDPWFRAQRAFADAALSWLLGGLAELAEITIADAFIHDDERREELARRCFKALNLLPKDESAEQAHDRLATLDSVEQNRVITEMRRRESRAEELRQKMKEERAYQAAARWNRE
jgi:hypothetical protein